MWTGKERECLNCEKVSHEMYVTTLVTSKYACDTGCVVQQQRTTPSTSCWIS